MQACSVGCPKRTCATCLKLPNARAGVNTDGDLALRRERCPATGGTTGALVVGTAVGARAGERAVGLAGAGRGNLEGLADLDGRLG